MFYNFRWEQLWFYVKTLFLGIIFQPHIQIEVYQHKYRIVRTLISQNFRRHFDTIMTLCACWDRRRRQLYTHEMYRYRYIVRRVQWTYLSPTSIQHFIQHFNKYEILIICCSEVVEDMFISQLVDGVDSCWPGYVITLPSLLIIPLMLHAYMN